MRNGLPGIARAVILLVAAAAVAGCMTSHSDTLVFGTNTKLAVDLSLNPSTSVPSMTVGYVRQEAVWMPLYVNAKDSKFTRYSSSNSFRNFSGSNASAKYTGNEGANHDTYSVLASFGADIKGGDGGKVGIAQYFATGLAARKLAANEHVGETLSVKSSDQQTIDAEKKATENLQKAMTYKELLDATQAGQQMAKRDVAKIDLIVDRVAPKGDVTGLAALLDKTALQDINKKRLSAAKTADDLRAALKAVPQAVDPLFSQIYTLKQEE